MIARAARFTAERMSYAVVVVLGLAMLVVAGGAADSAAHLGTPGFEMNRHDVVTSVDSRLGDRVRPGDVVLVRELRPSQRFRLANAVREGTTFDLAIERGGARMNVAIQAIRADTSETARVTRFIGLVTGFLLVIGLASLVFLSNPRVATLGFYFYTLVMLVKSYQSTLTAAVWPLDFIGDLAIQICYPLAQFLILLFAVQIFENHDRVTRALLRLNAVLGVAAFFCWSIPIAADTFLVPGLPGAEIWWEAGSDFAQILVTLVGLGYVARVAAGPRMRIGLVVLGISLPAINDMIWATTTLVDNATGGKISMLGTIGNWNDVLQAWFGPLGIVLVCYGLVLRRIVGFRSAVAQTAVATLASIVLLALFTLIDWATEKLTGEHRSDYTTIVTLLISGFLLRLTHHQIDEVVTKVLFKRRIDDAKALHEVGNALACTAATATIHDLLLAEPLRILNLPAAALFLEDEADGTFAQVASRGHAGGQWPQSIGAQGVLAARLRAERRPLRISPENASELFTDPRLKRALAVPLYLRGELAGVAVFAERIDDTPLDDDETDHFVRIATAAAAALDHVYARETRALHAAPAPAPA